MNNKVKIAVIGGLGTLAGADLFFKLLKVKEVLRNQKSYHFIFEQHPYKQMDVPLYGEEDIKSRKFYTYTVSKDFESRNITKILLPCFASHSFVNELQTEITIPIVNIYEAVSREIIIRYEKGAKVGVIASNYVKNNNPLQKHLHGYEIVYPTKQQKLMDAIYGEFGLKNGCLDGLALEYIYESCLELIQQGCKVILPCVTEISLVVDQLWKRGIPVLDVNDLYANYALEVDLKQFNKPFKLGVVGGVGPSATVDFMNKIILNTPAKKDQEHIKMIVEQNPQIPDRTAHLINKETDPTIALFSTCKRLEAEGVDAIAIPCNTAHAFVDSIQKQLEVPIINMLTTTAEYLQSQLPDVDKKVGLLATSGTIKSKVYHNVLKEYGFSIVIPDEKHQLDVMESIYGELGVKAGYPEGQSKELIMGAIKYLVDNQATTIILGCTELPLIFPKTETITCGGKEVRLIDPTLILAKHIVGLANEINKR